ncbi:hypothetical protein CsSME_00044316 [Camellia sinensis var. sinensis]
MGTVTTLAPGVSRKRTKVLETRTDTPDLLSSLNTLSSFYAHNNTHFSRNLQSTIDNRSLSINHEFLLSSNGAQQALDRVEEEVNALAKCCDNSENFDGKLMAAVAAIRIAKALNNCNATTGDIIYTTERINRNLKLLHKDRRLSRVSIINALREEDMNDNFFKALSHVQEIHANCKVLLQTHHQELLKTAVHCLKERPALFKYCAEEAFASERELVLVLLDPDVVVDTGPTAHRFSKGLEMREGVLMLLEIIEIKHNSMMITASGKNPIFDPVISALIDCIIQMCEQAAEAHMSKGAIHSSRRSRTSSNLNKSSVDAIFKNSSSLATSQPSETPSKIFLINCLCAIRQPVFGHEVYIMEKEVDAILRRCRLLNKMSHFHKTLTGEESPLADIVDTSPASLSESLKSLFGLILGSESSLPESKQMHIPKLRV